MSINLDVLLVMLALCCIALGTWMVIKYWDVVARREHDWTKFHSPSAKRLEDEECEGVDEDPNRYKNFGRDDIARD